MVEATLYDYLVTTKISEATVQQLDSSSKSTFVNDSNVNFWRGPITVSKVIDASRTYPHGLPIPEVSSIEALTVANAASGTIKPTGSEIWVVQALDSTAEVLYSLFDGSAAVQLIPAPSATPFIPTSPLFLTSTLYLIIANASGGEATVGMAYHKVSL
jgi:hypothetical protein